MVLWVKNGFYLTFNNIFWFSREIIFKFRIFNILLIFLDSQELFQQCTFSNWESYIFTNLPNSLKKKIFASFRVNIMKLVIQKILKSYIYWTIRFPEFADINFVFLSYNFQSFKNIFIYFYFYTLKLNY